MKRVALATLLLIGLAAGWWFVTGKLTSPAPASADSLATTRAADEHAIQTNADSGRSKMIQSDSAIERASRVEAAAQVIEARADSLAAEARKQAGSAILWQRAYEARTAERDSLQVALDNAYDAAYRARAAYVSDSLARAKSEQRRQAIERLNQQLRDTIATLVPRCRILGRECPSRKETVAGTLLLRELVVAARSARSRP